MRRNTRSECRGNLDQLFFGLSRKAGSRVLVQEFLGLVDLCGEVGASASVGVVEEHELPVGLADLVLGDAALARSGC